MRSRPCWPGLRHEMWPRAAAALLALTLPLPPSPPRKQSFRLLQAPQMQPPVVASCEAADLNGSGIVDVADLLLTLGAFGQSAANPAAAAFDLSGNGSVDVSDLLLVLGAFGRVCSGILVAPPPSPSPADACGCGQGQGWSSSSTSCADGGHTSYSEATACSRSAPARPPPRPEEACDRLLSDKGLNCGSCLSALPASLTGQGTSGPACPGWSAADDRAAERSALFPHGVRSLYNSTDWLWDEAAPVRRIELDMSDSNWNALYLDPAAEEYQEGTVRLIEGAATLGVWRRVGIRFKGSIGSLGNVSKQAMCRCL